jgi:S1-C subfamily serine protease
LRTAAGSHGHGALGSACSVTRFPGRTVVAGLIPGAPGEQCGLEVGDVIARVDGSAVHARAELYARIWTRSPGDVVKVDVVRDGAPVGVAVRSVDVEEFFA